MVGLSVSCSSTSSSTQAMKLTGGWSAKASGFKPTLMRWFVITLLWPAFLIDALAARSQPNALILRVRAENMRIHFEYGKSCRKHLYAWTDK
jgi:hypothetical protein